MVLFLDNLSYYLAYYLQFQMQLLSQVNWNPALVGSENVEVFSKLDKFALPKNQNSGRVLVLLITLLGPVEGPHETQRSGRETSKTLKLP
jgi:hypothetical protein